MQTVQRKKKLAPLKGAWEFLGLGEDPKNAVVTGQMTAIFEHVARLDGKPVPAVRLRDPHLLAYTQQELIEHCKRPGVSPVPQRQLLAAVRAFEYQFPENAVATQETIITIDDEAPYPRPPVSKFPFRRDY